MSIERIALLDTDVFSVLKIGGAATRITSIQNKAMQWQVILDGYQQVISFQTRAEVLAGAYLAGWGTRRLSSLLTLLDQMPTIDEDDDVIDAYARLLADCRTLGHPLGKLKEHVGDRWIAACAIAKDIPLLTGNKKHFSGAPKLVLLDQ